MTTERRFPVLSGPSVRWSVIAPHEMQALRNHGLTLEQLAERGGLTPIEALAVCRNELYPIGVDMVSATRLYDEWCAFVERTDSEHDRTLADLKAEVGSLTAMLNVMRAEAATRERTVDGEVWHFIDDPKADDLASLTCRVVIGADVLRRILLERDEAQCDRNDWLRAHGTEYARAEAAERERDAALFRVERLEGRLDDVALLHKIISFHEARIIKLTAFLRDLKRTSEGVFDSTAEEVHSEVFSLITNIPDLLCVEEPEEIAKMKNVAGNDTGNLPNGSSDSQ